MGSAESAPARQTAEKPPLPIRSPSQRQRPTDSGQDEASSSQNRTTNLDFDLMERLGRELDTQVATMLNSILGIPSVISTRLPPGPWIIQEDGERTLGSHSQNPGAQSIDGLSQSQTTASPVPTQCPALARPTDQRTPITPPLSQLEDYLQQSPYSPLQLEKVDGFKSDCPHPAGRFWLRDAFEDLLKTKSGQESLKCETRSDKDYEREMDRNEWIRGVQRRWMQRWAEDSERPSQRPKTPISADDYERFLTLASQAGNSKSVPRPLVEDTSPRVAKTFAESLATDVDTDAPISVTTSTQRTTTSQGVTTTRKVVTQRFRDGRSQVDEEIATEPAQGIGKHAQVKVGLRPPRNNGAFDGSQATPKPGQTSDAANGRVAEKGWFWK